MAEKTYIRQRRDYTYKHNMGLGRHGWLRLTPAYSVKIVERILSQYQQPVRVLDPFSGTGTTALCASDKGYPSAATEINPFLVWFGNAKLAIYHDEVIRETAELAQEIAAAISQNQVLPDVPPSIHQIEKWWSSERLDFLCKLKAGIRNLAKEHQSRDLLNIAFCRVMIRLSNAAFNHQSMSFKEINTSQLSLFGNPFEAMFCEEVDYVLASTSQNPPLQGQIIEGDARKIHEITDQEFDLVITSPPYPNRMSYIRELRPYMYWLGFLERASEAGELDWQAIGGTWGIATSRLASWQPDHEGYSNPLLKNILEKIGQQTNKNAQLMAIYVDKYFQDMWLHLYNLSKVLKSGAKVHYIVGNSTFYGVVVPSEVIYRDMLERLGFVDLKIEVIRKRNSKTELFEFEVSGRKL